MSNFQATLAANNHGVENREKFVQTSKAIEPTIRSWHKKCKREKWGYSDTFINHNSVAN